ncbi:hypothetical protein KY335_01990 [Candidatus Woesearchaeota archaeon]|jgi:hypothetical protein|nr:hypothetical protein [Candidatus Woesearchaeota archaeon]
MRGDTIKKIREEEMMLEETDIFDEDSVNQDIEDGLIQPEEGGFLIGFHSDREY